ncbi:hypothetical protein ACTXT7_011368 [Hymenolepis weldensis]
MGTYKPLHGTGFCRPCPPNSTSEAPIASRRCVCIYPLYVWQSLANDGSGICSHFIPPSASTTHSLRVEFFMSSTAPAISSIREDLVLRECLLTSFSTTPHPTGNNPKD